MHTQFHIRKVKHWIFQPNSILSKERFLLWIWISFSYSKWNCSVPRSELRAHQNHKKNEQRDICDLNDLITTPSIDHRKTTKNHFFNGLIRISCNELWTIENRRNQYPITIHTQHSTHDSYLINTKVKWCSDNWFFFSASIWMKGENKTKIIKSSSSHLSHFNEALQVNIMFIDCGEWNVNYYMCAVCKLLKEKPPKSQFTWIYSNRHLTCEDREKK